MTVPDTARNGAERVERAVWPMEDEPLEGAAGGWADPPSWVPGDACTLPEVDRPARLGEFDELFAAASHVDRVEPGRLRMSLPGVGAAVAERIRALTVQEARCCSFFDFALARSDDGMVVEVSVPAGRERVLDVMVERARAVGASR